MFSEQTIQHLHFALSIVLVILGSILLGTAGKNSPTATQNAKNSATGVLIIGLIMLFYSGYQYYSSYGGGFSSYYY